MRTRSVERVPLFSEESTARTLTVDTTVPQAPLITSPPQGSYDNDGFFFVLGTAEPGAKVELFEDTASKGTTTAGSDGRWSFALSGLSEGSHSFKAKATDEAGNTSAESDARTVMVDTTAPTVKRVVPLEDATGISPGVNVSAYFSEAMRAKSVKSSFKLYKKGSTTPLDATVTYDADTKKAVLDPRASLERGATYKALVTTGAKDLAGNPLSQQKVWFFTINQ